MVNENQLMFGANAKQPGIWFSVKTPECGSRSKLGKTAFITIQNEKMISSFCKSDQSDRQSHLTYNKDKRHEVIIKRLSSLDYVRHENSSNVYYVKNYGTMSFDDAHDRCKDDGTSLPVHHSGLINMHSNLSAGFIMKMKSFEKYLNVYHSS